MLISDIIIGERHRRDMGDLSTLAESIRVQGLLQPIGITTENELVFGERRLRAVSEVLGWTEIDVRVVNVTSIVEGEHDENELREAFKPSEKVAIGRAVEAKMAERRGRDNPVNIPEFKGVETREIAAQKAGFGSETAYRQAKLVVDEGVPELVEKMDAGLPVSAAAVIAKQDHDTQRRLVAEDKLKRAAADLRKAEAQLKQVESIPKPEPITAEQKAEQIRIFGTQDDRAIGARLDEVISTISEQPVVEEAVRRIPPAERHAIDVNAIRAAAQWLIDFAHAWEKSNDHMEAEHGLEAAE